MTRFQSLSDARTFVLAGNAYFTLRSLKTSVRFTYRSRASKDGKVHFVSVLRGPDNGDDYTYLGIIRDGAFTRTPKSKIADDAPSAKAFDWFWARTTLPAELEIWHEGRCGRCARRLTVPESIERGIGPECATRVFSAIAA